jgi:CubicO group peptidase (beta-lactamase class C family)
LILKKRGIFCFFVLFLSLILTACADQPAGNTTLDSLTARFDRELPKLLAYYDVPGASVALVQDGQVAWAQGYGLADVAANTPVTPETVFQVASTSKPVAAWGVMRLVEQGKIQLDMPVEEYIKRWRLPLSPFNNAGVTVRRLLSHTAGLSNGGGYGGFAPGERLPTLEESLEGKTNGTGAVRLIDTPGRTFIYSGGGYTLLQLMLEEVSGRSFYGFMQDEVLKPLGMSSTSFEWLPALQERTARAYDSQRRVVPNFLYPEQAAAGLYTTAPDYARWLAAAMSRGNEMPGRGVLDSALLTQMFLPAEGSRGAQGLGYALGRMGDGTVLAHHNGVNTGWRAQFGLLPATGDGFVVMTNSENGAGVAGDMFCRWQDWLGRGTHEDCKMYLALETAFNIGVGIIAVGILGYLLGLIGALREGKIQFRLRLNRQKLLIISVAGAIVGAVWLAGYTNLYSRVGIAVPPNLHQRLPMNFSRFLIALTVAGGLVWLRALWLERPSLIFRKERNASAR